MFEIPAALKGIPTSWNGHFFGRDGESLGPLKLNEIDLIRGEARNHDWSAEICPEATINDLDKHAIEKARAEYKKKHPDLQSEVDQWDDIVFLNKAKVTIKGNITNAAIILLGKPESEAFLLPSIAKMSWILRNDQNIGQDYEHFGPLFLLNTSRLFGKIRNLKIRQMPGQSLFPLEIDKYDSYVIREALHNCIAHQDYELCGRINVVEYPDELLFTNLGRFIPKTVENVIKQDAPQEFYRNPWLASAMVNLNMIDTIGSGIKKMFLQQKSRFLPLPEYDLNEHEKVKVTIFGKILDANYTNVLINRSDLDLSMVMALDRIQKKQMVDKDIVNELRKKHLVEGRYPNVYVSSRIAKLTDDKLSYIKNRAFDNQHYKRLILSFIEEYGSASRQDINDLLMDKVSDALSEKQKLSKINNLIYEMSRKDNTISNTGSKRKSRWEKL